MKYTIADMHYLGRRKQSDGTYIPLHSAWQYYWTYRDGSEGGMVWVSPSTGEIIDYDGAFDMPSYVRAELRLLGYV